MILFPISSLKSLTIATAMFAFFALILKIIYFVLLSTYFIPVALAKLIATSGGAGFMPLAPGTFGALIGLIISLLLWKSGLSLDSWNTVHIVLILSGYFAGVWACKVLQPQWGDDPSKVVIDETIGFWISILFLPLGWFTLLGGFVLFRFFDIVKPLGIKAIDRIKSNHAVMLDDVLAGVYSNVCLQIYFYFYG